MKTRFIKGQLFTDDRGALKSFNTFDMSEICRMYEIAPANTTLVRGWQGHQFEKKWMYCCSGGFVINLLKINDFSKPSLNLEAFPFFLDSRDPLILQVPKGYVTAIKAVHPASRLLVFSNFTLEESRNDDFRFPIDTWEVKLLKTNRN